MAASRKPTSASARPASANARLASASAAVVASAKSLLARAGGLRGKRIVAGLSGGVDSVVLLHLLHALAPAFGYRLLAFPVNHGLSSNANDWQKFCSALCLEFGIPFKAARVKVKRRHHGLEAAARGGRRAALPKNLRDPNPPG